MATLDPLALLFEGAVPALYDPRTAAQALQPASGGVELPVAVPEGRRPGSYTFATRLYHGDTPVSVLKQPLVVREVLTLSMRGIPMTKAQDPAIAVTVTSLANKPMRGTIRLDNRFFGEGYEPTALTGEYRLDPRGATEIRFALPRAQVDLTSSYVVKAALADRSGFTVCAQDDVSFQACEEAKIPIAVDGDLADWKLDELLPIPFERWLHGPRDPKEFTGCFYTRWDDKKLYFAAVIADRVPVVTGETQVQWTDDNIMIGIYPWRWHMGDPLNTGYYREHLEPIKGGGASFLRVGYVPSGPSDAAGAQLAVKRAEAGWLYEWAYPAESLYPLDLKVDGGFRLSMSVWDQRQNPKKGWGQHSWLTFSGFNLNINARPDLWRQFTFVE